MFEKQGKFYADWRDKKGNRKRKSFTTARAALQFEAEEKALAHPKRKAGRTALPRFSSLKCTTIDNAQVGKRQSSSSPSREASNRGNSVPRTSMKSTHISRGKVSLIRREPTKR
jgi:hypothetical protein